MCKLPDPLNVHKAKSEGGLGLPDPLGLFDSKSHPKDQPAAAPDVAIAAPLKGDPALERRKSRSLLAQAGDASDDGTMKQALGA